MIVYWLNRQRSVNIIGTNVQIKKLEIKNGEIIRLNNNCFIS